MRPQVMCKVVKEMDLCPGGAVLLSDLQYDGKRAHAIARQTRNAIKLNIHPYVEVSRHLVAVDVPLFVSVP